MLCSFFLLLFSGVVLFRVASDSTSIFDSTRPEQSCFIHYAFLAFQSEILMAWAFFSGESLCTNRSSPRSLISVSATRRKTAKFDFMSRNATTTTNEQVFRFFMHAPQITKQTEQQQREKFMQITKKSGVNFCFLVKHEIYFSRINSPSPLPKFVQFYSVYASNP